MGRRLADLEIVLGTHRKEMQVRGSQSHLIDLHPGGRVDLGAGGRVDEARQGERWQQMIKGREMVKISFTNEEKAAVEICRSCGFSDSLATFET